MIHIILNGGRLMKLLYNVLLSIAILGISAYGYAMFSDSKHFVDMEQNKIFESMISGWKNEITSILSNRWPLVFSGGAVVFQRKTHKYFEKAAYFRGKANSVRTTPMISTGEIYKKHRERFLAKASWYSRQGRRKSIFGLAFGAAAGIGYLFNNTIQKHRANFIKNFV